MNLDYLAPLLKGLSTTVGLTLSSLGLALLLALIFTIILQLKHKGLTQIVKLQILLFTGTPLLVQIFLIYYGPAQFDVIKNSFLWPLLSQPWFCAMLALALNSAAYSTRLFDGAINAVPTGDWEAAAALGLSRKQALLRIVLPHAMRRAIPAYGNEIILVLKGSSLASTITIMDLMGYAGRLNAQTYDTLNVFAMAGAIYLVMTAILTLALKFVEKKALAFSQH